MLEKMITHGNCAGHHDRTGAVLCKERCCERHKLDETDTERCMGRDELGWPLWHSMAIWWLLPAEFSPWAGGRALVLFRFTLLLCR